MFLTAGNNLTKPPRDDTSIEAGQTSDPGCLEAELVANPLEVGLDNLLLPRSDMYELNSETELSAKRLRLESDHGSGQLTASTSKHYFAPPKTEQEICKAKLSAIQASTAADMKYCVKIWNQWCSHRLAKYGDVISPLDHPELTAKSLAEHLSSFHIQSANARWIRVSTRVTAPHSGIQRFL